MNISERIKDVMKQKEISQYRLAVESKIPHSTLSALLNEETKNPSVEMISKISDTLNVTIDYLIGKTDVNLYDGGRDSESWVKEVFAASPEKQEALNAVWEIIKKL